MPDIADINETGSVIKKHKTANVENGDEIKPKDYVCGTTSSFVHDDVEQDKGDDSLGKICISCENVFKGFYNSSQLVGDRVNSQSLTPASTPEVKTYKEGCKCEVCKFVREALDIDEYLNK